VLETTLIALRLVQYSGAMILLGSSLFFIYALPRTGLASAGNLPWPKRLIVVGATALLAASLLGLIAQTAMMAGSIEEGLKPSSLGFVMTGTGLGRASLVRAGAAALAFAAILVLKPGLRLWSFAAGLGTVACASLAWMGHGAATEGPGGPVHLVADILHAIAAAVWIGALAAFLALLLKRMPSEAASHALYNALHGFSGVGAGLVAGLVATGLINSWFLVGPARLQGLWTTPYGQLLVAKLALFVAMISLAAANRFRHTPGLAKALDGADLPSGALAALRRSVLLETTAAFLVLFLVAWLGTLAPISAQ
jgi:putative copper resistance protein D